MKNYSVLIPEEKYQLFEFIQEDCKGIAVANTSFKAFKPKVVFAWHCSVMLHFDSVTKSGMPSPSDREKAEDFEDWLDINIKGQNKEKPNALFLGRITWNGTRELIWRVYEPAKVDELLNQLIESKSYKLSFDYRIDPDKEWRLSEWLLTNC